MVEATEGVQDLIHGHEQRIYDNRISGAIENTTFALDGHIDARHIGYVKSQAELLTALRDKGVKQSEIAELLGIKQPNVATLYTSAKNGKPRKLSFDEGRLLIDEFGLDSPEVTPAPAIGTPSVEMLEPILDALLPLAPPGRLTDQSRRALAEALSYGLELLGNRSSIPASDDAIAVAARAAVARFREITLQ